MAGRAPKSHIFTEFLFLFYFLYGIPNIKCSVSAPFACTPRHEGASIMPEQKTPNQNFPRLTMQQAKEEMACFQKIYPLTGHIGKDEQVRHNLSTYYYHFLL